ncbi:MAG: acyltransferase [Leptolyngbyaceae cyanobacterium CRU_2_3]|nr:acyltransferase [Leptolyngbyaceae cyanobacterium CRU_2_3]
MAALSTVCLPLFVYFRQAELHLKLVKILELPIALVGLALPLAVIEAVLRPRWIGFQNLYDDWANVLLYLVYLIYGYLLGAEPQFQKLLDRHRLWIRVLAIAGMSILLGLWIADAVPERSYSLRYMTYQFFRGFNSGCWVIMLLSFAQQYLNFNHPILRYLNEASYPFYMLHQTVVVSIGYAVVQWHTGIFQKFIVISTASLVSTLLLYDLGVKRHHLSRFLLGLKPANPEPRT